MYGLVDKLNDMETEMIGMKPKDAIKLKEVPIVSRESYPPEEILHEDGLYRYLLWKYQVNPRGSPRDRVGDLPVFCTRGVGHLPFIFARG